MSNKLFEGSGQRMKTLAKWVFVVGWIILALISVIITNTFIKESDSRVFTLLLMLAISFIVAYIISLFVYSRGELIEETCRTADNIEEILCLQRSICRRMDDIVSSTNCSSSTVVNQEEGPGP